jgi:excisionase family DNA binding protein
MESLADNTDVTSAAVRATADPPNVEHECMTARELASWMRVDRKTVYEYAARNVIPCRRLGRRLVFLRVAIAAWLARAPTVSAPYTPR